MDELLKTVFTVRSVEGINKEQQLRPDLSSERAPHRNKTAIFRQQHSDRNGSGNGTI
jgi:hypothetical protein